MSNGTGGWNIGAQAWPTHIRSLDDVSVHTVEGVGRGIDQRGAENMGISDDQPLSVKSLVDAPVLQIARGAEQEVTIENVSSVKSVL